MQRALSTPPSWLLTCTPTMSATQPDTSTKRPLPASLRSTTPAVAEAVDHFMLAVTGLHQHDDDLAWVIYRPRTRERDFLVPDCP